MSQQKPAPEPAEIAGRYQVIQKLGAGAFGTVYKAKDKILGRMLAIKTIRLEGLAAAGASLDELLDRFKREAQVSAQLKHPNIVTIYDIGDADGLSYLAMEFIDGVGLERVIASAGRLPVERAAAIGAQVADALDFAHRHSVVHRDIKPANIMIETGDRVKVTDFGIAKVIDSGEHLTMTGSLLGTPSYMSPEQARGGLLDGRSDLFSVGCVLYEMVTGKKAFRGESITALIFKIITEEPVPLQQELPDVPEELTRIIAKALAKAPETRYQSGRELAEDLLLLTRGGAMPTLRQAETPTTIMPPSPGAPTLSSAPTAVKAASSTQPFQSHTLPASAPPTQLAPGTKVVRPAPAARAAAPQKSRTGLILGLLAAGLILVLGIGGVGAYFLFLRPKPNQGGSQAAGGAADSQTTSGPPLTAPSLSLPPETTPVGTPASTPPVTTPAGTTPAVTTPGTAPRRDDGTGAPSPAARDARPPAEGTNLGFLDSPPPERGGREITDRVGGPYGRGGSGYATRRQLEQRQRFPADASPPERRAIWVLLNLVNMETDYHAKHGRYAAFNEVIPVPGLGAQRFMRHGYRFELTITADGFKIEAVPLVSGPRPLVTDEGGIVDYPE